MRFQVFINAVKNMQPLFISRNLFSSLNITSTYIIMDISDIFTININYIDHMKISKFLHSS